MMPPSSIDGADKGGSGGGAAPAPFADASKTLCLLAALQPGSVAPKLLHGEKKGPRSKPDRTVERPKTLLQVAASQQKNGGRATTKKKKQNQVERFD